MSIIHKDRRQKGDLNRYREAISGRDLRELLRQRGYTLIGDKLQAEWRQERTASVHVYRDGFKDYGDGEAGDLLDFLQAAEGLSWEQALAEACKMLGIAAPSGNGANGERVSHSEPNAQGLADSQAGRIATLVDRAHDALLRRESPEALAAWAYLEQRGLVSAVDAFKLGAVDETVGAPDNLRGRLIVPSLEGGKAGYYNARCIGDGAPKYLKPAGVTATAPFNSDSLEGARALGFLVLTEGELDAASLFVSYGASYPVMGLSGGNLPRGWAERIKAAELRQGVYLLFDADASGRAKAEKRQAELAGLGVKAYTVHLGPHKDANAALQALGPEGLRGAVDEALEVATMDTTSDLLYVREGWLAELDARANRPHAAYETGVPEFDGLLGGGYVEGLHVMGGITGTGKTSLALSIALHNALEGRPVLYATFEQSRLELWARIAARLTGVPYSAMKRGTYNRQGTDVLTSSELKASEGWGQLEQAAKSLKVVEGGDAFSRSESSYTVDVLAATAEAIAEDRGAPPLVICDYLQRMPPPAEARITDVRERVSYAAGILQTKLGRGLGCPVLALSSLNRKSYKLAELELEDRLAALKEAGELEYTAYTALLLYGLPPEDRGVTFSPGMMGAFRPMVLDVAKHREGRPGRLKIKWQPAKDRWLDAEAYPEASR